MAYFYKHGRVWRMTFYQDKTRKEVNLGADFAQAKIMKASIEQALQNEKFKVQLMGTLGTLGLTTFTPLPAPKVELDWEESRKKVVEHLKRIGRKDRTLELAETALTSIKEILKPASPADVTAEGVDDWIATLLSTPNKRDATGKKKLSPAYVTVYIRMERTNADILISHKWGDLDEKRSLIHSKRIQFSNMNPKWKRRKNHQSSICFVEACPRCGRKIFRWKRNIKLLKMKLQFSKNSFRIAYIAIRNCFSNIRLNPGKK